MHTPLRNPSGFSEFESGSLWCDSFEPASEPREPREPRLSDEPGDEWQADAMQRPGPYASRPWPR